MFGILISTVVVYVSEWNEKHMVYVCMCVMMLDMEQCGRGVCCYGNWRLCWYMVSCFGCWATVAIGVWQHLHRDVTNYFLTMLTKSLLTLHCTINVVPPFNRYYWLLLINLTELHYVICIYCSGVFNLE